VTGAPLVALAPQASVAGDPLDALGHQVSLPQKFTGACVLDPVPQVSVARAQKLAGACLDSQVLQMFASVDAPVPQVSVKGASVDALAPVPQGSDGALERLEWNAAEASSQGSHPSAPAPCCDRPPGFAFDDCAILGQWSPSSLPLSFSFELSYSLSLFSCLYVSFEFWLRVSFI
jgi:hypothetical protein